MQAELRKKLIIGTAQFGLDYGISNRSGIVSPREVESILSLASAQGIQFLDTAMSYGKAETVLGDIGLDEWQLVTKLPPVPEETAQVEDWVTDQITGSLERLRQSSVHAVLLHNASDLLGARAAQLYAALQALKEHGYTRKIGWSVYGPDDLESLPPEMTADIVQAPFNVFDNRFLQSGWLDRLKNCGTEIHVRSIFLQGLLLMAEDTRPQYFERWPEVWTHWKHWLNTENLSPMQACLGHALNCPQIDHVIVGVEDLNQLTQILDMEIGQTLTSSELFSDMPLELINPTLWKPN